MKAEYVYGIDELPTDSEDFSVGVVLSYEKERDQMHCGLSYDVNGADSAKVLHLGFQNVLKRDESLRDFILWIKPNIPTFQLEAFSVWCEVVWQRFQSGEMEIAYGLRYDEYAQIQKDGQLVLGEKNTGFTCATLILTLFHMCGHDLIDIDNWTSRVKDPEWQAYIVDYLKSLPNKIKQRLRITDEQIKMQQDAIGCKRYRPEDVAASSALYDAAPAACEQIQAEADQIYEYISSLP